MTTSAFDQRTNTVTQIWQDNRWLYLLIGFGLGMLATPALQLINSNTAELLRGLVPEAVGIVFTVLILDQLAANRSREALKTRLFNELRSAAVGQGTAALAWLKRANWIQATTLVQADLHRANWENAYVGELHLRGANLNGANLRNASNQRTLHDGTRVNRPVDFQGASLRYARLENAVLINADFTNAKLNNAHLENAVLVGATLTHAEVTGASWHNAILPDGTRWTPDTDISRYTHPDHPDYWLPEWAKTQNTDSPS